MSQSNATVTTTNMELTPCRVTYNGVDLGGTLDKVTITLTTDKANIMADQSGTTVRDRRVSGQKYVVKTKLGEINEKDFFKYAFPSLKKVVSGGNKSIYSEAVIGNSDLAVAYPLIIHPLSRVDADLSGDYKFYLATPNETSPIVFGPTDQQGLEVEWMIFPDVTTVPNRFFIHGDPSIGLVAASAGSPTPGGGNTGNGTVTGVSVSNTYTRTETITLTEVTAAANGGVFHVSGSSSGSLGLATVGVAFVSNPISFTINDGATDFVVGDSFTIATTAANYA